MTFLVDSHSVTISDWLADSSPVSFRLVFDSDLKSDWQLSSKEIKITLPLNNGTKIEVRDGKGETAYYDLPQANTSDFIFNST